MFSDKKTAPQPKLTDSAPRIHGSWIVDHDTRCKYSEGAGPYRVVPAAVAVPKDTEDFRTLVRFARERNTSLVPRGAGSGMPGGNVGRNIVVDTKEFNSKPRLVGESSLVCGAAVRWIDIDGVASRTGLRLPPDPASKNFCTAGGMVATNAAGPRTVKYGSIRNWVEAIEFVTTDGEVEWIRRGEVSSATAATTRFQDEIAPVLHSAKPTIESSFPGTLKNSSGYALDQYVKTGDLLDLIVGSEGTLGFITQVEFRLAPVPECRGTMLVMIPDIRCLEPAINSLKIHDPSAIELLDSTFLKYARENTSLDIGSARAILIVDIERDSQDEMENAVNSAKFDLEGLASDVITAVSPKDADSLWQIRHAASPILARLPGNRRSLQIIEDGCVPVSALADYLEGVKKAADKAAIDIVAFGHAGDGHLHVNAIVDTNDPDLSDKLNRLLLDTTEIVASLGGTTCGEHGDGRLRAGTLEAIYGREIIDLFNKIKNAFDPDNIMNPGVILPGTDSPTTDLKVGMGAENIPEEISAMLRDVERNAGWGSPLDWNP